MTGSAHPCKFGMIPSAFPLIRRLAMKSCILGNRVQVEFNSLDLMSQKGYLTIHASNFTGNDGFEHILSNLQYNLTELNNSQKILC